MTSATRRIACFCETSFEAELPETADCTADPEVEQDILSGDFMAVTCPGCGKRLTPEYPFRLDGVPGVGTVVMVPGSERAALARGARAVDVPPGGRLAVGYRELVEKLVIARAGLDDRVIEMMKFFLLTAGSVPRPAEGAAEEPLAIYHGREAGGHVFHVLGVRKDEVGIARLPASVYDSLAADVEERVSREPFDAFCVPPWVSVRRVDGGRE